jgi:hypothetical protein
MQIWHLGLSSEGRHPLFPSERERRAAVALVVRRAGPYLITFSIVDDHLHVVVVCDRATAGKLMRALLLGLRSISRTGFEPPYIKPVSSRAHLKRLVAYSIEQPVKHGLDEHPALWSGSAFADIVGTRAVYRPRIVQVLPRYRFADAWTAAGLPSRGVEPLQIEQLRGIGSVALTAAAAFAVNAPPALHRRTAEVTRARALVVSLGKEAGLRTRDVTDALDVTRESVRKLSLRPLDAPGRDAVLLRLGIEREVGGRWVR